MRTGEHAAQRAVLHVLAVDDAARPVLLDRPVLHIGRAHASCGLVLTGPDIAPHHCCLRRLGARWWLFDRGSPAGSFLNSERCREPTALRDGDRISLGLHVLEFRSAPALDLAHTLDRLGGDAVALDFTFAPPRRPPPRPAPRRGPLHTAGLAAAAGLVATLSIAADFAQEPPLAVPSHLSLATGEQIPSAFVATEDLPPSSAPGAVASGARVERVSTRDDAPGAHTPAVSVAAVGGSDVPRSSAGPARMSFGAAHTEYLAEPGFELPGDALARGRPGAGSLLRALQLPASPDYTIRCPAHAYASTATITGLMHALAEFRNRSSYRGELVVGDMSQPGGGRYGPHRSHQSGRDVDLWLPVKTGSYRRGCAHCGTDLCRPDPDEVDWRAAWELVTALAARGHVEDIFLAWQWQPALRDAARQLGASEAALARQIQHPVRGRAALVKHADGHIHHMHVRFRCPAGEPGCVAGP